MYGALTSLNVSEWSAVLTATATVVYTAGTFLLWVSTRRTAMLVSAQLSKQIAIGQSNAYHAIIDAHKDVWFRIISDADLMKAFGADTDAMRRNILGTILINHCARIFIDLERGVIDKAELESFIRDARDLFGIPFVMERWQEVRGFHQKAFADFVDALKPKPAALTGRR